jgi:hypothetical protein
LRFLASTVSEPDEESGVERLLGKVSQEAPEVQAALLEAGALYALRESR